MVTMPTKMLLGAAHPDRRDHDPMYESGAGFLNGEFVPMTGATIGMKDLGFDGSDLTYEKVTVTNGQIFRLQDHFDRFTNSCASLRLRNPYSEAEMTDVFSELIERSGFQDCGLWWCVTRGLANKASDRMNPEAYDNRFYAYVDGYASIATDEQRIRGLDVVVGAQYFRTPATSIDPKVKNLNWLDMKLSLFEARDRGADWSVMTDLDGFLTEAPGANIFLVKDGIVATPDSGCLEGITRVTAIELAHLIGMEVVERRVHKAELVEADDAFMTSTAGGIMPINSVDGIVLGDAKGPGPIATVLNDLYWEKLWSGWKCTPLNLRTN